MSVIRVGETYINPAHIVALEMEVYSGGGWGVVVTLPNKEVREGLFSSKKEAEEYLLCLKKLLQKKSR
jgi:hypothetical protein